MIAFGPVPSRRLGSSLGINHIPPKHCPYSCVYCQVGSTSSLSITRQEFFSVKEITDDVEQKLNECKKQNREVDYLTLVPDGEPTLDIHLGELIFRLKQFQIPIAVISNSALINRADVQEELQQADWVSLKVDSMDENVWKKINRPFGKLRLDDLITGISEFRAKYSGKMVTETMLIHGLNDNAAILDPIIFFLNKLNTFVSYFSIPTRPPAVSWVKPPDQAFLQDFLLTTPRQLLSMDILFEAETDDFQSTGDLANDILAITSVHPLREEALKQMVNTAGMDWTIVDTLVNEGRILRIQYQSGVFYLRNHKLKNQS